MVRDTAAYKEKLMTRKDKWGESTVKAEEVKAAITEPDTVANPETTADQEVPATTTEESKTEPTTSGHAAPQVEKHTNMWKLVN